MAKQSAKQQNLSKPVEAMAAVVSKKEISEFSGPLPHPEILDGYEKILAGSADRILKMAEEEAQHRRVLEMKIVQSDSRDSLLGIISATFICITALIVGGVIVLKGQSIGAEIVGALLGASGISGIIITMINSTRRPGNKGTENE